MKKKTNGEDKVRMCIDFRGLNSVTKKDFFPLPNIQETLESFGNANLFSVIDVASAYHQIDVNEEDKEKTGFSTPDAHYECYKILFGLSTFPSTFQRFMNMTLSGLNGNTCMIYLDDIIVFNSSAVERTFKYNQRSTQSIKRSQHKTKTKQMQF